MSSDNNISNSNAAVDTTPLLGHHFFRTGPRFMRRPPSLRGASRFIRQASSRSRVMREPSVRVREAAAEQIEERQSDWAYSKPIVILDLFWNLAFVIVSIAVMIMSRNESPSMPLRLWILGYDLQCVFHMACVWMEYKKRYSQRDLEGSSRGSVRYSRNYSNSSSGSDEVESGDYASEDHQNDDETSVAKHLESANTMFSFIWWIIGFYWVTAGGQSLTHDSPQLYWLCITFLAFDVFFVVICIAVACVIGIAVCCCLPCIIAILYAVADQEGATKDDIERLPKYKFRRFGDFDKQSGEIQESFGGIMTECDTDSPVEHVLSLENVECCICLCAYDDGTELRELPCRHHFHSACIDKWLYMNPTCPLCKFDILKNGNQSGNEEV
ncbi:E3 ubiquitin-protein ligase At1g12760-like [Olea europaea var. sylvestris]|uniref:E3 ubiquitin-protein ligase At1g12760-like n=1 Tax=Olea europaea var. sylvestris TaxID=158386 RepID=UPI000C1CD318|nr:E3 ubiquitin-protein ligase At1g12760-like [Olea europaea var. sylvestris]